MKFSKFLTKPQKELNKKNRFSKIKKNYSKRPKKRKEMAFNSTHLMYFLIMK